MSRPLTVLITNACHYAGPGSVPVLLRDHGTVYCHDPSFGDAARARSFEVDHPGSIALSAGSPAGIADELAARGATIETVVHNDVHPNTLLPIERIPPEMLQAAFEALLLFPVERRSPRRCRWGGSAGRRRSAN